jgi:hypothetical protein
VQPRRVADFKGRQNERLKWGKKYILNNYKNILKNILNY